jgi:hypothetical protein
MEVYKLHKKRLFRHGKPRRITREYVEMETRHSGTSSNTSRLVNPAVVQNAIHQLLVDITRESTCRSGRQHR